MKSTLLDILGYWGPSIILILTTIGLILYNYNFLYLYLFANIIGLFINSALKEIIKQPRPKTQKHLYEFENSVKMQHYGMPSGHAQSMALFATYFSLITYYRDDIQLRNKIVRIVLMVMMVIFVDYSRVYWEGCHTILQE